MQDSTPKACSLPGRIQLPVEADHIEAARQTLRENNGAQWRYRVQPEWQA